MVHADLALRHTIIADALGVTLPPEAGNWHDEVTKQLRFLLEEQLAHPIIMYDGLTTRNTIAQYVNRFRQDFSAIGHDTFVVSLDPAFLDPDLADYTFQETRISLISEQKIIDMEHNPRAHSNRFTTQTGPRNGSGKTITRQMYEMTQLMEQRQPVDLAVVEDYANTGQGFVERFGPLHGIYAQSVTMIAGNLNTHAAKLFASHDINTIATHTFERTPDKYIDHSDLIPSLGGRAIGAMDTNEAVPFTVGTFEHQMVTAVDAIIGNYPWQVDLHTADMQPTFAATMRNLSFETGITFWEMLEDAAGTSLSWADLLPLQGLARVFYPLRDKQSICLEPGQQWANSPLEAIRTLQKEYI
jgi:hypothetical protein